MASGLNMLDNDRSHEMAISDQIRVLTVDDHPLLLEGLSAVISAQPDMLLAGQAFNGQHALQQLAKLRPDVTLIDLRLPDMTGTEGIIAIQEQFPEAKVIAMTNFESDGPVKQALEAGADSYILKNMRPREIVATIRQVYACKKHIPAEIAQITEI